MNRKAKPPVINVFEGTGSAKWASSALETFEGKRGRFITKQVGKASIRPQDFKTCQQTISDSKQILSVMRSPLPRFKKDLKGLKGQAPDVNYKDTCKTALSPASAYLCLPLSLMRAAKVKPLFEHTQSISRSFSTNFNPNDARFPEQQSLVQQKDAMAQVPPIPRAIAINIQT